MYCVALYHQTTKKNSYIAGSLEGAIGSSVFILATVLDCPENEIDIIQGEKGVRIQHPQATAMYYIIIKLEME
jgi:hypothetical protein